MQAPRSSDDRDRRRELVLWLYVANITLLLIHEIDAAFWEEWDTFRLPIGIEGFLLFHLMIVPPLLYGLVEVARASTRTAAWSYALAAIGVFTFTIHAVVLALGNDDFRSLSSIAVLVAILVVSLGQAWTTRHLLTE